MELGHWIPRRCPCGALTVILTSKTKDNPADEAHWEELEALSTRQSCMEDDLVEIKEQLEDMKKDITEIVEVVAALSKKSRK
ncbi:unnamed protein product [Eruca vesicaria subsp. sativa]|uniref:Uncharacterized protein n=1 Tax=Eruca vesicaria subsp. sativa TaxID=29727 RepID=A0ABC8LG40_ERUVS|nr:unnamed protein product [Eruca vesicaria subsp. sativa]